MENKKMNKIFLITYTDHNSIEGYVDKKGDFNKWLAEHNKRRIEEGEMKEYKKEFKIEEIDKLW